MSAARPKVLLVRGHHPTVWGLRPWERLPERFEVSVMQTRRPRYDLSRLDLPRTRVRALRDLLPRGLAGDALALLMRDRVLDPAAAFEGADVVHAEDLSLWFSAQAARSKAEHSFKLVLTVWETIPLLDAFRSPHARDFRRATLEGTDLFLASTQRAAEGLLLEGVPEERIRVSYPGVDLEPFSAAGAAPLPASSPGGGHVIVSPGRLEWEKGHHDVLRALAALVRGMVELPPGVADGLRLVLIGSGPERERLARHASELGVSERVEFASVPYEQMPALFARASAMVLASLPRSGCALHPGDVPRCFWEEQFGLVIAESMAAGLPLVLSASGAIPEVAGDGADYFAPGDWMGIARALAAGPMTRPPSTRVTHSAERLREYSLRAAAERLAAAYDAVLDSASA